MLKCPTAPLANKSTLPAASAHQRARCTGARACCCRCWCRHLIVLICCGSRGWVGGKEAGRVGRGQTRSSARCAGEVQTAEVPSPTPPPPVLYLLLSHTWQSKDDDLLALDQAVKLHLSRLVVGVEHQQALGVVTKGQAVALLDGGGLLEVKHTCLCVAGWQCTAC